jgi:hypothetical protein
MNPIILNHFNAVEEWLLQSPVVVVYKIISKEIAPTDGKLRVKVNFVDGSMVELFEYVTVTETSLNLSTYSFHWQDQHGTLKCRWDNAPHHPELPNAPHHKHNADHSVEGVFNILNICDVLEAIEQNLESCTQKLN